MLPEDSEVMRRVWEFGEQVFSLGEEAGKCRDAQRRKQLYDRREAVQDAYEQELAKLYELIRRKDK